MRDEIQDRYGNIIYLTDERWEHIIKYHPILNGHRVEVLSAVRSGNREQDPFSWEKFYYTKTIRHWKGRFKKIRVVVLFHKKNDKPNNFIVAAYPR